MPASADAHRIDDGDAALGHRLDRRARRDRVRPRRRRPRPSRAGTKRSVNAGPTKSRLSGRKRLRAAHPDVTQSLLQQQRRQRRRGEPRQRRDDLRIERVIGNPAMRVAPTVQPGCMRPPTLLPPRTRVRAPRCERTAAPTGRRARDATRAPRGTPVPCRRQRGRLTRVVVTVVSTVPSGFSCSRWPACSQRPWCGTARFLRPQVSAEARSRPSPAARPRGSRSRADDRRPAPSPA